MEKDVPKQLGIRVRAARENAGLTQEELAERAEIDKDSVSSVERGRTFPSLRTMYDLAIGLGVDVVELIPPTGPTKSAARAKSEAEIRELLRNANDKQLRMIRNIVAAVTEAER